MNEYYTIKHLQEPNRLVLVWQASGSSDFGKRYGVGKLHRRGDKAELEYLKNSDDYKEAIKHGFQGFPPFLLQNTSKKIIKNTQIMDILIRRLPPRSRADFPLYLKQFGLTEDAKISNFGLLAYTETKLPGDGFSVVNNLDHMNAPFEFFTDLAGYKYRDFSEDPQTLNRKNISLKPEPDNDYDPNAIKVFCEGNWIGYINRIQAPALKKIIATKKVIGSVSSVIQQNQKTTIRLFFEVSNKVNSH